MEIWLDTCDIRTIASACRFGLIHGVTTNPSILSQSDIEPEKILSNILDTQDGPIAVQVMAENADDMVREAHALRELSSRFIIKIPVTQEGLLAIKSLTKEHIPVMATAVYQTSQALLAAKAGATYVAPYFGRMLEVGIDAYASLQSMSVIFQHYGFKTKILAAALRTTEQIVACAQIGIAAVTLNSSVFSQFIADDPQTKEALEAFAEDWNAREWAALASN